MQQIMNATEKEEVADTMQGIKKIVEEIPYLQLPQDEETQKERFADIPTDEDGDELEILDREYVTVDGIEYCVKNASSETEGWNPDRDYWYK